jgi:hypothetical protein
MSPNPARTATRAARLPSQVWARPHAHNLFAAYFTGNLTETAPLRQANTMRVLFVIAFLHVKREALAHNRPMARLAAAPTPIKAAPRATSPGCELNLAVERLYAIRTSPEAFEQCSNQSAKTISMRSGCFSPRPSCCPT